LRALAKEYSPIPSNKKTPLQKLTRVISKQIGRQIWAKLRMNFCFGLLLPL